MDIRCNTKQEQACVVGTARLARQMKISSQALLGPGGELIIEHGGREYRLRVTQNDKLILTA
jgi:hemin uptake protein HemP